MQLPPADEWTGEVRPALMSDFMSMTDWRNSSGFWAADVMPLTDSKADTDSTMNGQHTAADVDVNWLRWRRCDVILNESNILPRRQPTQHITALQLLPFVLTQWHTCLLSNIKALSDCTENLSNNHFLMSINWIDLHKHGKIWLMHQPIDRA